MARVNCAHCNQENEINMQHVLRGHELTMVVHYNGTGLQARSVWQTLKAFEDTCKACAKDLNGKAHVTITSVSLKNGKFIAKFYVDEQEVVKHFMQVAKIAEEFESGDMI